MNIMKFYKTTGNRVEIVKVKITQRHSALVSRRAAGKRTHLPTQREAILVMAKRGFTNKRPAVMKHMRGKKIFSDAPKKEKVAA